MYAIAIIKIYVLSRVQIGFVKVFLSAACPVRVVVPPGVVTVCSFVMVAQYPGSVIDLVKEIARAAAAVCWASIAHCLVKLPASWVRAGN